MKTYKIKYHSSGNAFKGEVFTKNNSPSDAMSDFFDWLKEQAVWLHLWKIEVTIEEIEPGHWI